MGEAVPEYPWFDAVPEGLKTRNQLAEQGLKPGGIVQARVVWRGGRRSAELYSVREAQPKRKITEAQRAVLDRGRATSAAKREAAMLSELEEREAEEREHAEWLAAKIAKDHRRAVRQAQDLLELGDRAVIIDSETTDLHGYAVELAALSLTGQVLLDTRLNPQVPIEVGAQRVHGITTAAVANEPLFSAVWPQLDACLRGRDVITYNVEFDKGVVRREAFRLFPEARDFGTAAAAVLGPAWHCAMDLYAVYAGNYSEYHDSYTWLPLPGAGHRALRDCQAVLRLLRNMARDLPCIYCEGAPCQIGDEVRTRDDVAGVVTDLDWWVEGAGAWPADPLITLRTGDAVRRCRAADLAL